MECGDNPGPSDTMIHQAPNCLEEGVDLRLLRSRRPVAPMHQCRIKVEAGVWGQGCVSIAPEVEPLLVPPLVRSHPLHGDVFVCPALAQLDHAAADERRCRLTPPNHLEKGSGTEVILPQNEVGRDTQIALA
jgi:hypothetical protein